ncbi:uncharacterized protein LOC126738701 [Anthonomus grandis grandis]|uniref:uncharacterized protein LOC126738701 n=1 Tax=Anthonomus grandis grandis TaxID=2921223 RepID=UPI0021662198|nr:uncharacterized protein LOC126738701 [Anthonomus grandis grandis]
MAEKIRKKTTIYPELPMEDLTPLVPQYHSLPHTPITTQPPPLKKYPSLPPHTPSDPSTVLQTKLCPIQKHYNGFLQDYIDKIDEILEKFTEIKKRAEEHHYKSNCAKVSGTVVSSTGAALVMGSLWWAPLTGGTSLALGAGGAVMSVTGSLTNALTDYIDYKTTAAIMEDIKLLLKEKDNFDTWMRKSLSNFNECITQLMSEGISKEVAISTIIEGIAKGAINIMEKPDNKVLASLSTAVKLHHIQHIAAETLPVLGKTFHMTEKSFQFVYNILGLTGRTVPNLMKDFAKISGVLSIAFTMADISILIKDLCSDHPSVDIIEKVIDKLKDEKNVLMDLLDILKSVENHKDGVFDKAIKDIEMIIDKEDLLKDFVIVNEEDYHERAGVLVQ